MKRLTWVQPNHVIRIQISADCCIGYHCCNGYCVNTVQPGDERPPHGITESGLI